MKAADLNKLTAGQLVRLRPFGYGARDAGNEDRFLIARIVNDDRYAVGKYPPRQKVDVDGNTFEVRGEVSSSGDRRLVIMVKESRFRGDGNWPWSHYTPSQSNVLLAAGRDIIGVWDDQTESAEFAAREERTLERQRAQRAAEDRRATNVLARRAELAQLQPLLDEAGIRDLSGWEVDAGSARITVNEALRIAAAAWAEGRTSTLISDFDFAPNPYGPKVD